MTDQQRPQHRNSLGYVITNREPMGNAGDPMIVWGRGADGKRIFIGEAARGGAEGLRCACGSLLIARKGEINAHHFAHEAHSAATCRMSQLTALAEFSAEALERERRIRLPPYEGKIGHPAVIAAKSHVVGDNAVVEITSTASRKLLVVVRTVTRRKALLDAALGEAVSSIVIDIERCRNLADAAIARAIVSDAPREWISNVHRSKAKTEPVGLSPNTSNRNEYHRLSSAELERKLFPNL